ncbi:hypothetical protein ABT075_01495 [Streptomyces sp. NPDC002677]|uniref:hypothetical protein n=1 Tax=Streptomyces sp. NPDC002677 TaxID=3154774 RepID=UPI0033331D42
MAGYRPADWHPLDLDRDPTPGDPQHVRSLATQLHDFADDVSDALRLVKGMAGEDRPAVGGQVRGRLFMQPDGGYDYFLKQLKE